MSESPPDTTDASVLGKRDRNGQQDEQATNNEEHTSKKMNIEDDSDSDDDVGPMPVAPGAAAAKKKRKGASGSVRWKCSKLNITQFYRTRSYTSNISRRQTNTTSPSCTEILLTLPS